MSSIIIIYDGECPFCAKYTHFIRLKQTIAQVELLNARENPTLQESLKSEGINFEKGIVVKWNDKYYQGSQALNLLSILSSRVGFFNRMNAVIFRYAFISNLLYPFLYIGRRVSLYLLNRKPFS